MSIEIKESPPVDIPVAPVPPTPEQLKKADAFDVNDVVVDKRGDVRGLRGSADWTMMRAGLLRLYGPNSPQLYVWDRLPITSTQKADMARQLSVGVIERS